MLDIKITRTTSPKEKPDENNLGFGKKFTDHMFVMDYTEGEGWHDARIVPYGPFELDPATVVFHYAQEIFEGMKAYRTADDTVQLFRPDCNAKRFQDSADRLCIPKIPEEDFVQAVTEETDMVFLCQPNNPTGQVTPPALVERLISRCADCGAVLVVDECFLDFLPDRDALTAERFLNDAPKLVILKAFTKLYAMAGVRLGYALCSDTALLAGMQAAGQPWAVSGLAQAAGLEALQESAYAEEVRALIEAERPRLAAGLRALGLYVIEGRANYLLFRAPADFGEKLRQHGAVVRSCGNYPGLDDGWYRTAVRTAEENTKLLAIMKEVLA